MSRRKTGKNIRFRKTPSSLKGDHQAQVYSKIKRLCPFTIGKISKNMFQRNLQKILKRRNNIPKFSGKRREN